MQGRDELRQEQKRFYVWLGLAATMHVAVLAAVVFVQLLYVRTHPPLKIVNVSLVSMPGHPGPEGGAKSLSSPAPAGEEKKEPEPVAVKKAPEPAPPPTQPKPEKKIPEPAAVKKIPEKPAPSKLPEPIPKKEAPVDERKNLQAALEQLKKKTDQKSTEQKNASGDGPTNLSSTLASLQKKVASTGSGTAYSGAGSGAGGGRYGSGGGGAFDPYKSAIAGIIQRNWFFSSQMVRSASGMEVYVSMLILPDGSVSQIRYDVKSTSEYLNNSVRVALKKSVPFPPLPREYGTKGIWVGFVFTPQGIGR
jgi:colicin import membrane protein